MVRPRGLSNKNAFAQFTNSISTSGTLRHRTVTGLGDVFDVNAPVAQMQKRQAVVPGVGRISVLKGNSYIPNYDMAVGTSVGSGYTVPSDGIYQIDAYVAVSGVAIERYAGSILVNNIPVSGMTSAAFADAAGAASVRINGFCHAKAGQVINVGVKSLHGNITTIGSEDLVHAPAANMRIVKLPSDELSFNG